MLAYFVEKLAKTPDGDGTLLDHSLVLYGSNMGNSNQHLHYDVPHVLVGGANGQAEGRPPSRVPEQDGADAATCCSASSDLYGMHQDTFGDSTGRIEDL